MSDINGILKGSPIGGAAFEFRETSFRECGPLSYVCLEVVNGAGHFFGTTRGIDGDVAIYDDWSRVALLASSDVFLMELGLSNTCIFFEYTRRGEDDAPRGGGMALLGSGVPNVCLLCSGRLYVNRVAHATILTYKGPEPTTYTVNR